MQHQEGAYDPKRTNLSPLSVCFMPALSPAPLSKWPSTLSIPRLNDVMTWLSSYLYLIKLERLLNIIWPLPYSKKILLSLLFFSFSPHFSLVTCSSHSFQLFTFSNFSLKTLFRHMYVLFFLAKPWILLNEMFLSYSSMLLPREKKFCPLKSKFNAKCICPWPFLWSSMCGVEVARYSEVPIVSH